MLLEHGLNAGNGHEDEKCRTKPPTKPTTKTKPPKTTPVTNPYRAYAASRAKQLEREGLVREGSGSDSDSIVSHKREQEDEMSDEIILEELRKIKRSGTRLRDEFDWDDDTDDEDELWDNEEKLLARFRAGPN